MKSLLDRPLSQAELLLYQIYSSFPFDTSSGSVQRIKPRWTSLCINDTDIIPITAKYF